jgi:hypothetical protein
MYYTYRYIKRALKLKPFLWFCEKLITPSLPNRFHKESTKEDSVKND